jgi:uncharacterized membrane protein
MSTTLKQALVLAAGGILVSAIVLRLARKRLLTTRYALAWLAVGGVVVLGAALTPYLGRLGEFADITPTGVLLALSSVVLLAISVQLSISVSQLQERLRSTAEAHALLEHRLAELERHR